MSVLHVMSLFIAFAIYLTERPQRASLTAYIVNIGSRNRLDAALNNSVHLRCSFLKVYTVPGLLVPQLGALH